MEAIRSSEPSVLTRATRHHIPEDGILHSLRRGNLKYFSKDLLRRQSLLAAARPWAALGCCRTRLRPFRSTHPHFISHAAYRRDKASFHKVLCSDTNPSCEKPVRLCNLLLAAGESRLVAVCSQDGQWC
jgi:hypothetical protein